MKFIGIILLLLTSIFLIACSANQASNKISNSELENLASKYGGVYIFNQKFVDEIEKREAERKELSKTLGDKIRSNPRKIKQEDKFITIYDVDTTLIDKNLPKILSNGKRYYLDSIDYENQTGKRVKIPKEFADKIINFIGLENYNKFKPSMGLGYFYIDNNGVVMPIDISATYSYQSKKYGLFGDEGAGIKFSKSETNYVLGGNKFYFDSSKNTFVKEK
ncbi:tRNA 2-selenouridine synthase [Campylobacter concisus]|uniref:tRNA 2-selenouridine synthase n=1 Tax=Campylobacter concisus TaxID=199 RepID=UPI00187F0CC4|nr:tRNA 2-selenouridine synthase [Campylobacter concisus]MBE8584833.1 tRNA 2-selenouridine synthase [Campylobacter concisus]